LIEEGFSITGVLKSLLKGRFDVHRYLSRKKTRPSGSMGSLPILERAQALQWPEEIKKEASYQSPLPVGTGLAGPDITGQFVKPGFIDRRYNERKNSGVAALSYEQSEQVRRTEPLLISVGESQLVRGGSAAAIEG
jgi:hypothetical protein